MDTPFFGLLLYVLGGLVGSVFYLPFKGVKGWAWESYWMIYAWAALIVCPLALAFLLTPNFPAVLKAADGSVLLWCYLFGAMWGVGGLTWGLMIRYLGVGLGLAIGAGLLAAVGTLAPPIFKNEIGTLWSTGSGAAMLIGVGVAVLGIVVMGAAGVSKERELSDEQKKAAVADFSFAKGLPIAILSGVMSAGMFLGISAGIKIEEIAKTQNLLADNLWIGLPKMVVILAGGFTINFLYCLILNLKNRTGGDYCKAKTPLLGNYILSALAGVLWYLQMVFVPIGDTMTGSLKNSNASMMMASMIIFSTLWAVMLHEWRGVSPRTRKLLAAGLLLLIASLAIVGYGNYLEGQRQNASPPEEVSTVAAIPAGTTPDRSL
ncbi:MAG: rhamnose/proton symporter RhaT [Pirellulales bacterium]|nr:rhamnose/proton symporter RhaT [Pirellulales bacterium]